MGARRASSCSPVYLSPAATGGGAGVAATGGGGAGVGALGEQLLSANIAAIARRKGACVIFEASARASAGCAILVAQARAGIGWTPDVGRYLYRRQSRGCPA